MAVVTAPRQGRADGPGADGEGATRCRPRAVAPARVGSAGSRRFTPPHTHPDGVAGLTQPLLNAERFACLLLSPRGRGKKNTHVVSSPVLQPELIERLCDPGRAGGGCRMLRGSLAGILEGVVGGVASE